eukprot:9863698-Karenia_brevis.AAC.1
MSTRKTSSIFDKASTDAKHQHQTGHGYIMICTPSETRVAQVAALCASLTSLPGVHDAPVGWCDHGL